MAANPITATATQPRIIIGRLAVNFPMTDFLDTSKITTTIRGTAIIPLITALQNNAFIGLIGVYWIASPRKTLTVIIL